MLKINRFTLVSLLLVGAYVLSACGGTLPQSSQTEVAPKVQAKEVVFTGILEAMNGNEWIVSGQKVTVDPAAALDPNITVGMIVKVEGQVSADGVVTALKIETSSVTDDNANDANANTDDDNANVNSNDDNSNGDNSNDDNGSDDNSNSSADDETEVFGVVDAITADSITISGVTYFFAEFTEIKDAIAIGDTVKIHVIVNADGTFTIREIEKSDDLGDDNGNDDNSNTGDGNDNSDDDNGNDDNSDDDNGNGDDDDNGNDDNSGDDDDDDNGNDD